jgi:hypothetical protein
MVSLVHPGKLSKSLPQKQNKTRNNKKKNRTKQAGGGTPVEEYLPSKHKVLSVSFSTAPPPPKNLRKLITKNCMKQRTNI